MRALFISAFILLGWLPVLAQSEVQERILFQGDVKDTRLNPVAYVNILVKPISEGTISDYYGYYRITAFPGDTLVFSSVSFRKVSFIVPYDLKAESYNLDVVLSADTIGLKEIVVYPWPSTYKQFKEDLLDLEVQDPLANLDLHLPSKEEMKALAATPGVIFSMPGPATLLYNRFSKEARTKRTYAEAIRVEKAESRYNKSIVTRVTGLQDESRIREFMNFCNLDVKFVLESTDYELYEAIRKCYNEFAQAVIPADSIPH